MPMSEAMKQRWVESLQATIDHLGVERGQEVGPQGLVDGVLELGERMGMVQTPMHQELLNNREEAERIAAGCLGLM